MAEKPQAGGAALQVVAYGERLTGWLVIAWHSRHMSCSMRPTISTYQLAAAGHIRKLTRPHVFNLGMGTEMFYRSCLILLCQDHICQRNSETTLQTRELRAALSYEVFTNRKSQWIKPRVSQRHIVTRWDRERQRRKRKKEKSRKRAVRERGLACYIRRPLLHNAVVNPCVPY